MKIINVQADEIFPYIRNAKKHDEKQIQNVAESIKQFGFVQPIVIDKDNNIIIGHCRFLASQLLNMEEVPCVKVEDLSDIQVNKLRLLDNKLNESSWDFELLKQDVPDMDFEGFDIDFNINTTESYLDDLLEDGEDIMSLNDYEKDYFEVSVSCPIEYKTAHEDYIKKYGKDKLVEQIILILTGVN